jgi:hypothetical protein
MNRPFKSVVAGALAGLLVLSVAAAPAFAREQQKGRWLKIRVYGRGSSTPTVLVNLPMTLVSAAARILARSGAAHAALTSSVGESAGGGKTKVQFKDHELDVEEFLREIESLEPGQILEVQDEDERVSIRVE